MSTKNQSFQKDSLNHHAFLVEGSAQASLRVLEMAEKILGKNPKGHPDVLFLEPEVFGIDEGRFLARWQLEKPISGDVKIAIIRTPNITREAQNSLLKIFEDPIAGTHFFLIVPDINRIIKTLASRFSVLSKKKESNINSGLDVELFIASPIGKRMEMITPIFEEKDRARAKIFLTELEEKLSLDSKKNHVILENILRVKKYLADQGSSVKIILEEIAVEI